MSDAAPVIAQKIKTAATIGGQMPLTDQVFKDYVKRTEHKGRKCLGTVVEAIIVESGVRNFSSILDAVTTPTTIGVCEVDGAPNAALVILDPALTFHLVDVMLGGDAEDANAFSARRSTAMDCALCRVFVDAVLSAFAESVRSAFTEDHFQTISCSYFEHTPMMANIIPEHAEALFIRMDLDIGDASRLGKMDLVIPLSLFDVVKAKAQKQGAMETAPGSDPWFAHMIGVVMETELEMIAEVYSTEFTVAELSQLDIGQVLPINPESLQDVKLQLEAPGGEITVARGRLGAVERKKAVKLSRDPDQEFLEPMRKLRSLRGVDEE